MGEVTLHEVSKRFTLRVEGVTQNVQALSRVSFTVREAENVTVDGNEWTGCGHDRGMVFQLAELLYWLTARENVMFGLEMKGMRGRELSDTATYYLDLVGLADSRNRRPHQL